MKSGKFLLAAMALSAVSFNAPAQQSGGYTTSGPAGGAIWKNPFGLCWRTGYWTPALANAECDPDLVPKPAAKPSAPPPPPPPPVVAPKPAPAPVPAPAPAAKPAAPPKPRVVAITISEPFALGKATLTSEGRARIDKEVIARMGEFSKITFVHVEGHTDRLGSHEANQKLSERRADAVANYLISKGVDRNVIETLGSGKTNPVKSCPDTKDRKALVECLAPNRRVTVEIRGMPK